MIFDLQHHVSLSVSQSVLPARLSSGGGASGGGAQVSCLRPGISISRRAAACGEARGFETKTADRQAFAQVRARGAAAKHPPGKARQPIVQAVPPPAEPFPASENVLISVSRRSGSSWKRHFSWPAECSWVWSWSSSPSSALRMFQDANDKSAVADKSHTYVFKARNLNNIEEKAFKLVLPEKGWASDNTIRQRLGAVTAWRSADQDAWFAVAARDYGQTKPRDAELVRLGIERLEQYFEGGLELAEKPEPAKWSGTEGQRLLFKGQLNAVTLARLCLHVDAPGLWLLAVRGSAERGRGTSALREHARCRCERFFPGHGPQRMA